MKNKILCMLSLIVLCMPLQVHAQEISSKIKIEVAYSDGITPEENDDFIISYEENGDKKEMEVNTSLLLKEQNTFFLEEGEYQITDIEYRGENEKIKEQGYVVSDSFQARPGKEAYDQIYIGIGSEASASVMEREDVVSKLKEKKPEIDKTKVESEEYTDQSTDSEEELPENKNSVDNKNSSNKAASDKNDVQETTSIKISPIKKGIPLLILMIGTFGTVWYFHKKGKI